MGLGLEVNKSTLDNRSAQAVLELRSALDKVETISKWLSNHPVVSGADPLIDVYGYNEDEAYALRYFFESVDNIRKDNVSLLDTGRKMTGLE